MRSRPRFTIIIGTILGCVVLISAALSYESSTTAVDTGPLPNVGRPARLLQPNLLIEDAGITVTLPTVKADLATQPGVTKATLTTPYREVIAERQRWFATHVIAPSQTLAVGTAWSETVAPWMAKVWDFLLAVPGSPARRELVDSGQKLLDAGCKDPAVQSLLGLIHPEYPVELDLLRRNLSALKQGRWSPVLQTLTHLHLARAQNPADPLQLTQLLSSLVAARDAGDFTDDAGAAVLLAVYKLVDDELTPYLHHVANHLATGSDPGTSMPAWATATLLGNIHLGLAWRFRGSGYSDSVTAAGWRGFASELALARTALESACQLAPQRSEPRVALLTVLLGEGGDSATSKLEHQFADIQTVCPDHVVACDRFIAALRPRWFGTPEMMLEHGTTWAQSGDFTGYLPWAGLSALRELDRDLNLSGEVYLQPDVPELFDRVAAGYMANAQSPISAYQVHEAAFRAAFLGQRYALALTHWQAFEGKIPDSLSEDPRLCSPFLQGMCELASAYPERAVEALIAHPEIPPNPALLTRLLNEPKLSAPSRFWIEHLRTIVDHQAQFTQGRELALPGTAGLRGWLPWRGTWSQTHDALTVDSAYQGHLLPWAGVVGDHFVLSGRIEVVESSNGGWQAGVVFGHLRVLVGNSEGWGSVRFRPVPGGVSAELSNGFMANKIVRQISTPDQKSFVFQITIRDQHCSVLINHQPVLTNVPLPEQVNLDAQAQMGLGAYMSNNRTVLRYGDLRLSQDPHHAETGGVATPP